MSSAQGWSVKGIDPKIREAAREAAARQGMTLAEYLNHALSTQRHGGDGGFPTPPQQRARVSRLGPATTDYEDDEDWTIGGRPADPARLAQRIESIERRTQLAVTGLDRAVSTIDRSVLGLAARIDDAEAVSTEAVDRISEALEQIRAAGETLSGRLQRAEAETTESRRAFENAASNVNSAKERLEQQVAVAEEIARRAEAAASFLSSEMETRETTLAQTLAEARAVAEEAARQAAEASAEAVKELRKLQDGMSERLIESEGSTRRAIENAVAEVRSETANETRGAREALLEEVVRLEAEIAKRVGAVDDIKAEHAALIARIERAEAGARESTAGLRQAAGAAIADLRNAQLTLTARVKQVEDIAGGSGAIDLTDLRQAQQDIAERLAALEGKTENSPVADALAAFEARLASVEAAKPTDNVLDDALKRLADRIAETESTANTAIRTLEETVSSLGARIEQGGAAQETEAVRALLEQRLDTMAQSVREELTNQIQTALAGGEGMESALADVNRRLAAAERRQAQTIEAISIEIRRMSETVDTRLRAVEARNDDAAAAAVREELSRMATTLEQRFDEIERREAAAFDRMGLEVGRLSERLEERVGTVEQRSAQAIEHVGEQVARMAERFNQRQDQMARELGERMIDSEERASHRVSEAISSIMERLAEVETHSQEAIAPVQKAVSSVASKLEQFESGKGAHDEPVMSIPTPARRAEDFPTFSDDFEFSDSEPYASPMDAAQPVRAAPLPPRPQTDAHNDDIYFAEDASDIDDLLESVEGETPFLPPETPQVDTENATAFSAGDDHFIEDAPPFETAAETAAGDAFWDTDRDTEPTAGDDFSGEAAFDDAPDAPMTYEAEQPLALDVPEDEAPPASKHDYLANARKAAQAQSLPRTRPENAQPPKLSLRGSSRIVLWGAASLVTLLLAGGAYYMSTRDAEPGAAPQEPAPPASDLHAAPVEPPAADPLSEAPVEGIAPGGAATPPIAANGDAQTQPVVAGPLPARNVSLEQAAQSGDLTAQYELALQRITAGRTQEGVTMMRRAADRGFAMAQYRMAKIYERGEGVTADLTIARQWTERAAAAGNRRAMHDLGVYFARGEGAPLDEAAAFRWFRQAAELGVADSQYNLGVLYQQGRGVNASPTEALFWFTVASRQGDQDAAARATAVEAQLSAMQIEQARTRAQSFRPRAASAVANGEFGQRAWTRPAA